MNCPYCGVPDTMVFDTRPFEDGNKIKRRRACNNCHKRFSTIETAAERVSAYRAFDGSAYLGAVNVEPELD